MNAYTRKLEARRDRLEAAADRAEAKSQEAYGRADLREEASGIPLGQPILVGHHSERRHRKAIERADNAMRQSIKQGDRAKEFRAKADAVGTGGVSSDDPEALRKLREKLEACEDTQTFMKQANKATRASWNAGIRHDGPAEDIATAQKALCKACGREFSEAEARDMLKPDFANRIGFPAYMLSNNNAEISRLKKRIKELEASAGRQTSETEYQGICTVTHNAEENRIQFLFDGKPDQETRGTLKQHGFKWAPSQGAWQRQWNNAGEYAAQKVLELLTA